MAQPTFGQDAFDTQPEGLESIPTDELEWRVNQRREEEVGELWKHDPGYLMQTLCQETCLLTVNLSPDISALTSGQRRDSDLDEPRLSASY